MKNNKKGFTLAELLIVMAIILILAAIAIPSFTKQLEASRETSDVNALRAAYSEAMTEQMFHPADDNKQTITGVKMASNGKIENIKPELPFDGVADLMFSDGKYSVTFDFSTDKPKVSMAAEAAGD